MAYLHYWFANSGEEVRNFEDTKRRSLQNQLGRYYKNTALVQSNNAKALEILDILESVSAGQNLSQSIATQLSNVTSGSQSGIKDYSYQQLGLLGSRVSAGTSNISTSLANAMIGDLGNCARTTQTALNQMMTYLNSNSAYSNAVSYAIAQYATTKKNISSSQLLSKALKAGNEIVAIDPSQNFSVAEQTLIQLYARIQSMIDLIPSLGSVDTAGLTYTRSNVSGTFNIQSTGHLIAVLVGKVGGNISYFNRYIGRIADARGQEVAQRRGATEVDRTIQSMLNQLPAGKNFHIAKRVIPDRQLSSIAKQKPQNVRFSQGGTTFVLNDNDVSLTIGNTIPDMQTKTINIAKRPLSLKSSNTLGYLFKVLRNKNHSVSDYYIRSLATGIESVENGLGYSAGTSLQQGWRSLVDCSVVANFLDTLIAAGGPNGNLFLLANNRLLGIGDLLNAVIDNPDAIEYTGGKQRSKFWQLNRDNWVGGKFYSTRYGILRSNRLNPVLTSQFNATIVETKLNLSVLNLL